MELLYAGTDDTPTAAEEDHIDAAEVAGAAVTAEDGVHQVFWAAALDSGTAGAEDEGVHHVVSAGTEDSAGGVVCSAAVREGVHQTVLLLEVCCSAGADGAGVNEDGMPQ